MAKTMLREMPAWIERRWQPRLGVMLETLWDLGWTEVEVIQESGPYVEEVIWVFDKEELAYVTISDSVIFVDVGEHTLDTLDWSTEDLTVDMVVAWIRDVLKDRRGWEN